MYRRGFSVSSLRNSARSAYYRVQRHRNRRSIFAGLGCLVVGVIVACCLVAVVAVYLVFNATQRGAVDPLPMLALLRAMA